MDSAGVTATIADSSDPARACTIICSADRTGPMSCTPTCTSPPMNGPRICKIAPTPITNCASRPLLAANADVIGARNAATWAAKVPIAPASCDSIGTIAPMICCTAGRIGTSTCTSAVVNCPISGLSC